MDRTEEAATRAVRAADLLAQRHLSRVEEPSHCFLAQLLLRSVVSDRRLATREAVRDRGLASARQCRVVAAVAVARHFCSVGTQHSE